MAAPTNPDKTYRNAGENEPAKGGFPAGGPAPLAPPPAQQRRPIDAATMPDLARGGVDGQDKPSGRIQE